MGLRWSDVSFADATITIRQTRVLVNARIVVKSPKSRRSARVLPLFEPLTSALAELETRQRAEMDAAGSAYVNSGYVAADEIGQPVYPEHFSDQFAPLCRAAGVPVIRLHDTRSTINSLLERAGVPDSVRAGWMGHSVQINRAAYLAPAADLTAVADLIGHVLTGR